MPDRLMGLWAWLVARNLCPCGLKGPEWSTRLCGRIDAYAWRSGYWVDDDAE